jgi:hypothetical protein
MSAGPAVACVRSSSALPAIPVLLPQSFDPTAIRGLQGCPVVCSPQQLRLHPALEELGWTGVTDEFNHAARLKHRSVTEPILITTDRTILAGIGRWRLAVFEGRHEINCIEYPLSEDEALLFLISHYQPYRGWNAFVRIRLALKLKPYFQQKALENMRAGGKYKGSAKFARSSAHRRAPKNC